MIMIRNLGWKRSDSYFLKCSVRYSSQKPFLWECDKIPPTRLVRKPDSESFLTTREAILRPHLNRILTSSVYDVAKETPLDKAPTLSERLGYNVMLKREDLQPIFSFKIRGAHNKISSLSDEEKKKGVAACSAGNHAQGVAYSARHLGVSAKIFMPTITPRIKLKSVLRLGSEVILAGDTYDEAQAASIECCAKESRTLIHPFDDPLTIAGQGTVALELLKQTRLSEIEAIFMACGGGGLLSGVGAFIKAVAPSVKVIGVEAEDAAAMTLSLSNNRNTTLDQVGTFADGAAVKRSGSNTFELCQQVVDGMILVKTDDICGAIKAGFADSRVVLEPAGALGIAGMIQYAIAKGPSPNRGKLIAITSGANMDFDRLRHVSERADTSEHLLSVVIPEGPGTFLKLCQAVFPYQITEFSYRMKSSSADDGSANILMSLKIPDDVAAAFDPAVKLPGLFKKVGFSARYLDDEFSKVHLRHFAGGRTQCENEVVYRFEFPDAPGGLIKFLNVMNAGWNVSMWHYRNHGSDVARTLCGVQVPPKHKEEFKVASVLTPLLSFF
eukprot:GHVN01011222.1.p1 GENE.GHVN01011222.1~~GHVN01011222.1.p1  ORF type:complete len:555 (+),score=57.12 GHVN01011222.1:122-1786(+)